MPRSFSRTLSVSSIGSASSGVSPHLLRVGDQAFPGAGVADAHKLLFLIGAALLFLEGLQAVQGLLGGAALAPVGGLLDRLLAGRLLPGEGEAAAVQFHRVEGLRLEGGDLRLPLVLGDGKPSVLLQDGQVLQPPLGVVRAIGSGVCRLRQVPLSRYLPIR